MKKNCMDCYFNIGGICVFLSAKCPEYPYDCLYDDVVEDNDSDSDE